MAVTPVVMTVTPVAVTPVMMAMTVVVMPMTVVVMAMEAVMAEAAVAMTAEVTHPATVETAAATRRGVIDRNESGSGDRDGGDCGENELLEHDLNSRVCDCDTQ